MSNLLHHARTMRREGTDAEATLWHHLRARQVEGFKFRRQEPLGPYILDFICFEARLIVEADGGQHADNPQDAERTAWLEAEGFRVLRFWNNDILQNTPGVLEMIRLALLEQVKQP